MIRNYGWKTNSHVNYEPSSLNGLEEDKRKEDYYRPFVEEDYLIREAIDRTNDFKQAGETYRAFEEWERGDLINNLVSNLKVCAHIQHKEVQHFLKAIQEWQRD